MRAASLIEEGERVIAEMAKSGLVRGADGLEVYVMCEIPSNVLRAPEFARIPVEVGIDGLSLNPDAVLKTTLDIVRLEQAQLPILRELALAGIDVHRNLPVAAAGP